MLRARFRWVALAWSALLAAALTWPVVLHPAHAALGSPDADGLKHLWTLWWMRASAWQEGRLPFHTKLVNFPVGMDLYPIEPLNGLVAVALPGVPVVLLSNLLVFGNLVLTGLAGAWFGRLVGRSPWSGLVAATLLEGSSVMAFFVHVGVGELLHLWWLPLGFGLAERARREGGLRPFLLLGLLVAGATLSCFYLGFFLGAGLAGWGLLRSLDGRRTPAWLARYALAGAVAVALVWPVARTFSTSFRLGEVPRVGLVSYVLEEHGQPVTDPPSARLDPLQLVVPARVPPVREEAAYGGGRYLGLLALALAFAGLARRPRDGLPLAAAGLVGVLLATGTYLVVGGEEVVVSAGRLRMPLFWLNRVLGYLAEPLNFPVRALALAATAVAGLGALAAARRPWMLALALLAVVEQAAGDRLPWPWATFAPRPTGNLSALRAEPEGAVLDLALAVRADEENRDNALAAQIAHGRPTNAVPVERVEYFARDGLAFFRATAVYEALRPIYQLGRGELDGEYTCDWAVLGEAGFRWMVVSWRRGGEPIPEGLTAALRGLMGPPVAEGPGIAAWRLPAVELDPEVLERCRAAHARRMEEVRRALPGLGPQLR